MKNKSILAFLGFALAFALPAMAQKSASGFYAGVGLGQSTSSDFCNQLGPTCKDKDQTWRVLGGYQISRNFAVEAGYQNLGDNADPTTFMTAKAQVMELVGIAAYPITRDFSVFGKAGAYRGRMRGANLGTASFNVSNTDLTMGLGVQWHLIDALSLRGEYQRYPRMGGGSAGPSTDYDVWSVSAIFRFQ